MSKSLASNKRRRDHSEATLDARTYLNKVQATLQNHNKYTTFCLTMTGFKDDIKADRVDYVSLATRVKELFKGHDNLILGFNEFLPKKHKIILDDDTVRFQEAISFVNKVHLRFYNKEHVYKDFLDVMNSCRQGTRSVNDVYRQVAALFKEHHDLIKEFERFIISVEGNEKEKEKVCNKKYNRGLDLCVKIQNKFCNSDDYINFLKCMHYYSTGVISRSGLRCLVVDVLEKDSCLVDEFDSFLNYCEKLECKSKEKRHVENCTPSYWLLLPDEYQIPSTGRQRSKLGAQVLNDLYVSRGKGCSSKPRRKDKHQEILFKCEDVRFELDMLLNSVELAAMNAADLLDGIKEKNITLEAPLDIKRHFTYSNLRCIEDLYGEHGLDVLDSFRRSPSLALPFMLTLLKQKHEELKRRKENFNKFWAGKCMLNRREYADIEERLQIEFDALLVTY